MKLELISFDNISNEADIKIISDSFELLTYCSNFIKKNNVLKYELVAFLARNIQITGEKYEIIKNSNGYYSYTLMGKLIEKNEKSSKILINDIEIKIEDYVPNDIEVGNYISFDAMRIDFDII